MPEIIPEPPNQPAADPAAPSARGFIPVRIAVLTVSDTRTLETDASGQTLAGRIAEAGHLLSARAIVRDDVGPIRRTARAWLKRDDVDVILTTGGTGLTGRDVTIEAMRALFEKEAEGFAVAFHMLSWGKIGTSTMQSRATAGVAKGKYIFCLPGSPGACRDAWDGLLKPQLDYRHKPCNFVEIMPRLDEHLRRRKG
jgi:molybdenum cofactor biosynthesis protein B